MNFQVGWQDNHPLLTWSENHEPDFAYYEIYKITSTFYGLYDTTSNTSYVDVAEDSVVNPNFEKPVSYKIRAVDTSGKRSIFTNTLTVAVRMHNPFNGTNSSDGNFLSTQLVENYLYPNYPNPFNPITTIKFSLKNDSFVYLNVYDINGRLVKKIVNGFYKSGVYSVIWDGTNLFGQKVSSGIYFYTLKVNNYFSKKKLILLK